MYDLVEVRKDEVFTTSKVIADGTNNKHHAIQTLIQKYESNLVRLGSLSFEMRARKREVGGVVEKVYLLNEQQATLLMMLMRNDGVGGVVVEFKTRLTEEFFRMRDFIRQKQSAEWTATRQANKENRLKETDVIQQLVEYAKEQGSNHSDMLYTNYTKLAKRVASGNRDEMSINELNNITLAENIILQTIRLDMLMDKHYKEIYQDCKERIEQFKDIAYLNDNRVSILAK